MILVKLGGSLLDLPDLAQRIENFFAKEAVTGKALILVGGGRLVDSVRIYDAIHRLDTQASHWLCVDLMHQSAQLLCLILGQYPLLRSSTQFDHWLQANHASELGTQRHVAIVSPAAFYSANLNSEELPKSWDTTSDSMSALLAHITCAAELIMLKSTDDDSPDQPLLDSEFSKQVAKYGINWRVVNLRDQIYV